MKIGDTTASYLSFLLHTAERLGANRDQILQRSGLDPRLLNDGDNRIDLAFLMRIGYNAIKATGRRDLGLLAGNSASITRLGYAGLAAMTAPDLGAALQVITRYEDLFGRCYRGNSSLQFDGKTPQLCFYSIAPYNDYTYFVVDAVLAGWAQSIAWLTGRDDLIASAHIEFPTPEYYSSYQRYLPCPVHFNQEGNALKLKDHALKTPLLHHDETLHTSLLAQCELALSRVALADSFHNKVQKVLGTMLHGRTPTIEEVSQQLNLPTWTLRRKLKEEETSFQILVDEMRRDVALSYMRNTDLSFGEISYLLGFSTPGAFQRAFKRWAGTTPGDFRKALQQSAP